MQMNSKKFVRKQDILVTCVLGENLIIRDDAQTGVCVGGWYRAGLTPISGCGACESSRDAKWRNGLEIKPISNFCVSLSDFG